MSVPDQETRDSVLAMAAPGASVELMSQRMADAKLEMVAAIKLLREATHSTLYEANERIHFSDAYSYRRVADNAFRFQVP